MQEELLPRFITNQEVDPLLGSQRTRERWEHDGILPPGELISGYRSAIRIFPDFAVARLAAPRTLKGSKTLQRRLAQITRNLYRGPVFNELRDAFKEVLVPKQAMGISQLVDALLPTHRELLKRFASEVRDAEQALRELNIDVAISLAHVVRSERNFYLVEFAEGGEREVSWQAAPRPYRFEVGDQVVLERARMRGYEREFLFPAAVLDDALTESRSIPENAPASSASELFQSVLADKPTPIEELVRGREQIDLREELRAGRVGVIDTDPVLIPTTEARVRGLTYSKPAFN